MSNQPPGAGRVGEHQVEGTSAFSPNPVPQLGGKPFESKQEVTQLTGMDSVEKPPKHPVNSRSGTTDVFLLLLNVCGIVSNTC
jgi:hypothetical protein